MKHTPLPWKLEIWEKTWDGGRIEFTPTICTDTDAIAKACALYRSDEEPHKASEEQIANAAYIVRTVNSHEELLEVLRSCITSPGACCFTTKGRKRGYYKTRRLDEITRIAIAAIAKATEEGT